MILLHCLCLHNSYKSFIVWLLLLFILYNFSALFTSFLYCIGVGRQKRNLIVCKTLTTKPLNPWSCMSQMDFADSDGHWGYMGMGIMKRRPLTRRRSWTVTPPGLRPHRPLRWSDSPPGQCRYWRRGSRRRWRPWRGSRPMLWGWQGEVTCEVSTTPVQTVLETKDHSLHSTANVILTPECLCNFLRGFFKIDKLVWSHFSQ